MTVMDRHLLYWPWGAGYRFKTPVAELNTIFATFPSPRPARVGIFCALLAEHVPWASFTLPAPASVFKDRAVHRSDFLPQWAQMKLPTLAAMLLVLLPSQKVWTLMATKCPTPSLDFDSPTWSSRRTFEYRATHMDRPLLAYREVPLVCEIPAALETAYIQHVHSLGTEAARAMQVTRPNEIRRPGVRLHPQACAVLGLEAERATPKRLGTLVPRTCMHGLETGYGRKSGEPLGFRPKDETCASTGAHPPGETSSSRWRQSALPRLPGAALLGANSQV